MSVGHVLQVTQGHEDAAGASTHKRTSGGACEMIQRRGGCLLWGGGGGKEKLGRGKKMRKKASVSRRCAEVKSVLPSQADIGEVGRGGVEGGLFPSAS